MTKAPRIKYRKAFRAINKLGFIMVRQNGSHGIFKKDGHKGIVTILMNKPSEEMSGTVHKGLQIQLGPELYEEFIKLAS